MSRRQRRLVLAAALGLAWLGGDASRGHELGAQQVRVSFPAAGRYAVDLGFDPVVLLQRVELARGEDPTPDVAVGEAWQELARRKETLLQSLDLVVDGRRLEPTELRVRSDGESATGLELGGALPGGARELRLSFALVGSAYALEVQPRDGGSPVVAWLEPGEPSDPLSLAGLRPSRLDVARRYGVLGFTHILPKGLDHILFVLGIFLVCDRLRPLLAQVSAFTAAHSVSLALSMLGFVSLPPRVVEPLIALSLVYVAVENLLVGGLGRSRVAVVFGFGLLHGLGFAGVLRELGLPPSEGGTALLAFNAGVELGQLAVLALAFAALATWRGRPHDGRRALLAPASLAIALAGLWWTIERLAPLG